MNQDRFSESGNLDVESVQQNHLLVQFNRLANAAEATGFGLDAYITLMEFVKVSRHWASQYHKLTKRHETVQIKNQTLQQQLADSKSAEAEQKEIVAQLRSHVEELEQEKENL
ncbi:MAG: hypothetical protein MHPSP_000361, partial [Paramarteilia canceri]